MAVDRALRTGPAPINSRQKSEVSWRGRSAKHAGLGQEESQKNLKIPSSISAASLPLIGCPGSELSSNESYLYSGS